MPETATFTLPEKSVQMFEQLRKELAEVTLMAIDENKSFVVETYASQEALSATLNQEGRTVAFFSRSLNHAQKSYPS